MSYPVSMVQFGFGAFIGNYDKGGHMLSLRLRYHPDSREASGILPRKTWIFPLFNTVNVMEMAGQEYARILHRIR